jgi:CheY-like chemotaxis protein
MPNLNGFETAALIYEREKLKHIPIIFITANTYGEENVFKGYRTGGRRLYLQTHQSRITEGESCRVCGPVQKEAASSSCRKNA